MQIYKIILIVFVSVILCSNIYSQNSDSVKWEKVCDGLNFPEGPAWDIQNQTLYFSNCYGGYISRYHYGKTDTFLIADSAKFTIQKTNGLAVTPDGKLLICEYGFGAILISDRSGQLDVLVESYEGEKFNRPNDITIDFQGNIYFTDPKSYSKENLDGRIFFVNKDNRTAKLAADGLAFPNGINISPLDGRLYVCESAKEQIVSFEIQNDNTLTDKQIFITLPGGDPDGIEFDKEGNLYAAHFGGGKVYVISADGKIIKTLKTPGKKPTNLEFGDDDLRTLYLTETETNSLYKLQIK